MKTGITKIALFGAAAFVAMPAIAHPGHLIEVAGHSHWGAIIALGGAIAIGIWAVRGKKKPEAENVEPEEEEISEAEPQEA